jgi:hypothetical protein
MRFYLRGSNSTKMDNLRTFGLNILRKGIETLRKLSKNRRTIWIVMFHFTITIFLIKYFVVFRVLKAQPEVNGGPICRTTDSQLELNNVQREKKISKKMVYKKMVYLQENLIFGIVYFNVYNWRRLLWSLFVKSQTDNINQRMPAIKYLLNTILWVIGVFVNLIM